jgi:hypothetical protein
MSKYKVDQYIQKEYGDIVKNSDLGQSYELGYATGVYNTLILLGEAKLLNEEETNLMKHRLCEGGERVNKYFSDIYKNEQAENSVADNIAEMLNKKKDY